MLSTISVIEIPKPADDPELAEQAAMLIFSELGDNPYPDEREMELQLAYMKPKVTIAAISDELVVATGILRKPEPEVEESVGHITDLAVASEYRRLGLGRDVVDVLERKAKEAGAFKLSVYALRDARGFYERLGYQRGRTENPGDYFKYL